MKKFISVLLAALMAGNVTAHALVPYDTGETMNNTAGIKWIKTHTAQARVERILSGNFAFVAGETKFWAEDKKAAADEAPYMEDGVFYIPEAVAKSVFGIDADSDLSAEEITQSTDYDMFFDERGFCLFSKDISCIRTDYASNVKGYHDYYTVSYAIGTILWDDITVTDTDYATYISNWQRIMTVTDSSYTEYIDNVKNKAYSFRKKITKVAEDAPFYDLHIKDYDVNSIELTELLLEGFERVEMMAKAYYLDGCKDEELKADILYCLDVLYGEYSKQLELKNQSNWTVYSIDLPYAYSNALCLMYDDLAHDEIIKHTNAIFDRNPDPTTPRGSYVGVRNYTNLTWCLTPYLNAAVLAKDEYRINYCLRYLCDGFMYSTTADNLDYPHGGIYKDGSLIFHDTVPYNMGYGSGHIENIAGLLLLTENTGLDIKNVPYYENIYDILEKSFLPFIEENIKMKAVSGRWDPTSAENLMIAMMIIAKSADDENKEHLSALIKGKMQGYEDDYSECEGASDAKLFSYPEFDYQLNIFKSETVDVEAQERETGTKVYSVMDKSVTRGDNFTAVGSLSSFRNSGYECIDKAGRYDWYIGSGAMFIYNGDNMQFNTLWLDNVNPYYIPGTTVDETVRETNINTSDSGKALPENEFAGGATDGESLALGMEVKNSNVSGLTAKKSYFIINGKIICIGSDIKDGNGNVHTTVDNRYMISEE